MTKIYSLFFILALLVSCKSDSFIELDNPENPAIDFNFVTMLREIFTVLYFQQTEAQFQEHQ